MCILYIHLYIYDLISGKVINILRGGYKITGAKANFAKMHTFYEVANPTPTLHLKLTSEGSSRIKTCNENIQIHTNEPPRKIGMNCYQIVVFIHIKDTWY